VDIADFSLNLFSLAGRNALVTGGNTGLGRAFSVALATAGADVFAVGLAEDDGTTRRLIEGAGRRMEFMLADITRPGVPAAIVRRWPALRCWPTSRNSAATSGTPWCRST